MTKSKDGKTDEKLVVSAGEVEDLVRQIQSSNLPAQSQQRIIFLINAVMTLRLLLEKRTLSLKSVLKRFFGLKTEKRASSGRRPKDDDPKPGGGAPGGGAKRRGGRGRNGRGDFPGAKRVAVPHECLKAGDGCPACATNGLAAAPEGVAYRWSGQPPLVLTIFLLERLICHACKTTYTAAVPGEARRTDELDPSAPAGSGGVAERRADASAAATIASLRFEMGVPHFRIAEVQAQQGAPLAPSTQYKIMDGALRAVGEAIFGALEKLAGRDGELVINDDTHARVIDLEQAAKKKASTPSTAAPPAATAAPPRAKAEPAADAPVRAVPANERKEIQTTAIVVRTAGQTICLHYTGHANAGENLAHVLQHRAADAPPPKQMCDGLLANLPGDIQTILGNCLDHARRKYHDVEAGFPSEVEFVLKTLGAVYANDAKAKKLGLSPAERLAFHQAESAPHMDRLHAWAACGLAEHRIEPNSTLGGAVKYMLKRWPALTAFLRIEGMPLSSAEVERLIKRCIRYRKNSLHYKTERGARLGDVLMSLIQTCRYARVGTHDYLTAIARHAAEAIKAPDNWLPWNFRAAVAALPQT